MSSRSPRPAMTPARLMILVILLLSVVPAPHPALAQARVCRADVEPNNTEAEVEAVEGAFCIAGDLPAKRDQDLLLWTVTESDAKSLWSLTVTTARILTISSQPGVEPAVAGMQLGEVSTTPESTGPVSSAFLVAPRRYLVGISRTDTPNAVPPPTTAYEFALSKVERLPKREDKEPNESQETASPLAGALGTAGARLVKEVDRLGTYLQSLRYLRDEPNLPLDSFRLEVEAELTHPVLIRVRNEAVAES